MKFKWNARRVVVGVAVSLVLSMIAPVVAGSALRWVQIVAPGQSIQVAIDHAAPGGWVYVLPGTYRETASTTNGLSISRSVHLVGLSTARKKVVLKNSGTQRNGIVAVPAAHTNCMSCHATLAPPFDLLPGVAAVGSGEPAIRGVAISGITIEDFTNNGLFTRNVDGFAIVDVHAVGNKNYGIFPTRSRNGVILRSSATGADDSGIWIETSTNITVAQNVVTGNVVGVEVSNSDNVLLTRNEASGNSVGMAMMFLPDAFDEFPDLRRITIRDNHLHDNNKVNTARAGSPLATVPSGMGIFHLGADDSLIVGNDIENHGFVGIGVADYCVVMAGGPFDCATDPRVSAEFLLDSPASNNRVVGNRLRGNGTAPDPANPFAFAASDLGLMTFDDNGNCYRANIFATFFSTIGVLPPCD